MNILDKIMGRSPFLGGIQNTFGQGNPMSQQNQAPGVPPPAGFGAPAQIVTPPQPAQQQQSQQGGDPVKTIMSLIKMIGG